MTASVDWVAAPSAPQGLPRQLAVGIPKRGQSAPHQPHSHSLSNRGDAQRSKLSGYAMHCNGGR